MNPKSSTSDRIFGCLFTVAKGFPRAGVIAAFHHRNLYTPSNKKGGSAAEVLKEDVGGDERTRRAIKACREKASQFD
jgi:hypothetical protein